MKINKDWKAVFKRYSFITHLLIAISSMGMFFFPFLDYVPLWVGVCVIGFLALCGVVGSFIKQEINEDKQDDNCRH
jgi:hypothetical protein